MQFAFDTLEIAGYRGEQVPNTFLRQHGDTTHLAVILPGFNATCDTPPLYYSADVLLGMGADALRVEYAYNKRHDFPGLSQDERRQWFLADVTAACKVALDQRPYARTTLVGKSLGTRAMGYLLTTVPELAAAEAVWLTPLLRDETLLAQILHWRGRSLFVIGTADEEYDATLLHEAERATQGASLVIPGAGHSLQIEGDTLASIEVLAQVVQALDTFLREK